MLVVKVILVVCFLCVGFLCNWLNANRSQNCEKIDRSIPSIFMFTPLGGGYIIFAFSGVRRPTWFPDILGNSSYPIFTKFGLIACMGLLLVMIAL